MITGLAGINTIANLERAWRQAKRWAATGVFGHWSPDPTTSIAPFFIASVAADFESSLAEELEAIHAELATGEYTFSPYFSLFGRRPGGGVRALAVPQPRDDIVAQAVLNVIGPAVAAQIPACAYAFPLLSVDDSSVAIFEPVARCCSRFSAFVNSCLAFPGDSKFVVTDITGYFSNLDQDVLLEKLKAVLPADVFLLGLLEGLLHYTVLHPDGKVCQGKGLPAGPAYSSFLGNFYLAELDAKWAQRTEAYARYMDDMVFVLPASADVDEFFAELELDLSDLGLSRNTGKTFWGELDDRPIRDWIIDPTSADPSADPFVYVR